MLKCLQAKFNILLTKKKTVNSAIISGSPSQEKGEEEYLANKGKDNKLKSSKPLVKLLGCGKPLVGSLACGKPVIGQLW